MKHRLAALIALGLTPAALAAPSGEPRAQPGFTEVSEAAGLHFVHGVIEGSPGAVMHGGGAVGDFDGDGWPDLFLVGGGLRADALFINQRDGRFEDEAAAWGLEDLYRGVGATAADYDHDGDLDLFVTSMGPAEEAPANGDHRLYRNEGGRFVDVARTAGLAFSANPISADGYGATWGDYDLDGDLDLWVGGWHARPLGGVEGNRLFRNEGDGTFADVTVEAGVFDPAVHGFGAVFVDMDGDRYPELLVAGDFGSSRYFVNRGDGTFTSGNPLRTPVDRVHNGMGTTVADFDRDGGPDWFVSAIWPAWMLDGPPGNRLYLNRSSAVGHHALEALPPEGGVNDGGWGWGAAALDFDHDGWVDLVHTNGWVHDCPSPEGECYEGEPTYLFRNRGDGRFEEVGTALGLEHRLQGRGLMTLDYDRDGDLDIAILANADRATLFRNDLQGPSTSWLQIELDTAGSGLAPHGLGARITVEAGGTRLRHTLHAGANYLTRSEGLAHFGLGAAESVDRILVEWADGSSTRLEEIPARQRILIGSAGRLD